MARPKNDNKIIMYISYPLKMKIGLYMQQKNIKSYSEFLRLATFFLINNLGINIMKDKTWNDWKQEKEHLEIIGIDTKKINDYKNVIKEIKEVIKKID